MSSVEDAPESEAASRSGVSAPGPVESITIDSGDEADVVFPAASVRVAVTLHVPSESAAMVQFVALPIKYEHVTVVEPFVAVRVMVSPADPPEALKVGVVSLVLLSVVEDPVSDAVARSTDVGTDGADVSTTIDNVDDADDAPPVGCVSVAEIVHVPSASVPRLHPVAGITYVHVTFAEPALVAVTVIVSPVVYVPGTSINGVLSLVKLSVVDVPRSDAEARSGAWGALGLTAKVPAPVELEYVTLSFGASAAPVANEPG